MEGYHDIGAHRARRDQNFSFIGHGELARLHEELSAMLDRVRSERDSLKNRPR